MHAAVSDVAHPLPVEDGGGVRGCAGLQGHAALVPRAPTPRDRRAAGVVHPLTDFVGRSVALQKVAQLVLPEYLYVHDYPHHLEPTT
jgi:hypothetical protein